MTEGLSLRANSGALGLGLVSLSAGLGSFLPADANAQAGPGDNLAVSLSELAVNGDGRQPNTLELGTGLARLPGRVQDTPQAISVVPGEVIRQQQATTLEQALRNVPGITVSAGEGNGGISGDQFRIRGFQAKNDVYVDGLRDFGVYARDAFNIGDIVVIKGPASETLGLGTVGGAVNIVSKRALLTDFTALDALGGSGPTARGSFDVNRVIDATTAIRLNGVVHRQNVQDRNLVHSDRAGFAASLGFGLGTDTQWHLNYLYQRTDRTPDFGVSTARRPGDAVARPLTEFGLDRATSYVRPLDRDVANTHLATSLMKWTVSDWLTVTNDSRLSFYDREFASTTPICTNVAPSTCATDFFRGLNPFVTYSAGGGLAFQQDAWGAQNVTTALAKFHTGALRHEAVTGIDVFYQNDHRVNYSVLGTRVPQRVRTPDNSSAGYALALNRNNQRRGDGANFGYFVSDRVWLAEQFSLLGGVRIDRFVASFANTNTTTGVFNSRVTDASTGVSPKGSGIWQPTPDQTYYFTYARGFSPPGQFVAQGTNIEVPSGRSLQPEISDLYELGGKVAVLDGRLGLAAALFRVDKSNSFDIDPVSGNVVLGPLDAGERRRVEGFELTATGRLTEEWSLLAGYVHLDGRVLSGPNTGRTAPYVTENAYTMWTTYDLTVLGRTWWNLPGRITIGGGVTIDDGYFPASDNTTRIPGTFSLDALVSYETDTYRLAINAYNLTDELNYAAAFNTRAVPTSGRTVLVSAGLRF